MTKTKNDTNLPEPPPPPPNEFRGEGLDYKLILIAFIALLIVLIMSIVVEFEKNA